MTLLLSLALAATVEVRAGEPLRPALARLGPGDTLRLGPGRHRGGLGKVSGVTVEGSGAAATVVEAGEDEPAATVAGDVSLRGLTLAAGPIRCGLAVQSGTARVRDAALTGGACGAFVEGGRLDAGKVTLTGGLYGLLVGGGQAALDGATLRGEAAGAAMTRGAMHLARTVVTGPAREAAVSVSGGTATLDEVVVADPGPSGIAVLGGKLEGREVTVSGPREAGGLRGDCLLSIRGQVRLRDSMLLRCGGLAGEVAGGFLRLESVYFEGGREGGIALTRGARAELEDVVAAGSGPALVVEGTSSARIAASRWLAEPALQVDCAGGARVTLAGGSLPEPCPQGPAPTP
ncbi:MAG TPA: hypothetical protein VLD85_08575 [Anaeromyxobacteraceae bacterium]|nr:hypothetical protein [Anaeromyxobacteraceae bacterium]